MRRILLTIAACFWITQGAAVVAEEQTLDYHLVVHVVDVQTLPATGISEHVVGIAAFRGLAIFDDGRIAGAQYAGHFDFKDGAGQFAGYALWKFDHQSELRSTYIGEAVPAADGGITFSGRHSDITGTGQYADFTGDGTFAGRRVDLLTDGGDTYQRGSLSIRPKAE
ncbi:MAG: hypothetical protein GY798_33085 [Hyphomicrobiales bacterium]|nr:hypothetical protein [Hyphomicrobiales bacterium]